MARSTEESVKSLLKKLTSVDTARELFSQLNYDPVRDQLSRRDWNEKARTALTSDPLVIATHGDFKIIYCPLDSTHLRLGLERPVVTRLLQQHPYSLFAFSNRDCTSWHFVNVKFDEDTGKRRLFRRITVGPDERLGDRLRTAAERLRMIELEEISPTLLEIPPLDIQGRHDDAFDVEPVQKAFFKTFAELFGKVADDIATVRGLEEQAGKHAQLLLNQLLFLYFIQKKGWLNGEPDYLYSRFRQCLRKDPRGHSFYSTVLYPLFQSLSDAAAFHTAVGAVPFLNGGLFEETARKTQAELLEGARLKIKNSTFSVVFDDLLEKYNFTVTEDTPLDMEVAIDPEMLGKIFESLILQMEKDPERDFRKLTGSYYTPRPIVHFMCHEALTEYLITRLGLADGEEATAARLKFQCFLALPPADHLDDEQTKTLAELFSPDEAKTLRQAILACRVCDPAVGSGAFPVGMLHEMQAAVARLDLLIKGPDAVKGRNYDYDLKKRIIESCLYGVDIQEQAVRLCELRLWLSLVVDYQLDPAEPFGKAIRKVPSLPNLSYRIVRGDSLLERLFGHVVQLDQMAKDDRTKKLIHEIQNLKQLYFGEGSIEEKRRLEMKILSKQAELAERLIEEKRSRLMAYQPSLFGEQRLKAKESTLRGVRERQVGELADMREKISKVKDELERLARHRNTPRSGDLDALRRNYFQTGSHPTFIWRIDFAEVFAEKGGFDIVIMNPPYSYRLTYSPEEKTAFKTINPAAVGTYDSFVLFLGQILSVLSKNAAISVICPVTWLSIPSITRLRDIYLTHCSIQKILWIVERAFEAASVNTQVFIATFQKPRPEHHTDVGIVKTKDDLDSFTVYREGFQEFSQSVWAKDAARSIRIFVADLDQQILNKFKSAGSTVGSYADCKSGYNPYEVGKGLAPGGGPQTKETVESKPYHSSIKKSDAYSKEVGGSDIQRFVVKWPGNRWIKYGDWLAAPRKRSIFEGIRVLVREITGGKDHRIVAGIVKEKMYHSRDVIAVIPKIRNEKICNAICAILNSHLISWYHHRNSPKAQKKLFPKVLVSDLEKIPMPKLSPSMIDKLHEYVNRIVVAYTNSDYSNAKILEQELDHIIYLMYNLDNQDIFYIEENKFENFLHDDK